MSVKNRQAGNHCPAMLSRQPQVFSGRERPFGQGAENCRIVGALESAPPGEDRRIWLQTPQSLAPPGVRRNLDRTVFSIILKTVRYLLRAKALRFNGFTAIKGCAAAAVLPWPNARTHGDSGAPPRPCYTPATPRLAPGYAPARRHSSKTRTPQASQPVRLVQHPPPRGPFVCSGMPLKTGGDAPAGERAPYISVRTRFPRC